MIHDAFHPEAVNGRWHGCRTRSVFPKALLLLIVLTLSLSAQRPTEPTGIGCVDELTLTDGKYLSARGWAIGKDFQARVKSLRFYASRQGTPPTLIYEDTPISVSRPDVIQALLRPGLENTQPGWALPLSRFYQKLKPGSYRFSVKVAMTDGEVFGLGFSVPTSAEVIVH